MARQIVELTPETTGRVIAGFYRFDINGIKYSVNVQKRGSNYCHYLMTKVNNRIFKTYIKKENKNYTGLLNAVHAIEAKMSLTQ